MKMNIIVKKDEVDAYPGCWKEIPTSSRKRPTTSLIVQDGETIVISGLTKQTNITGNDTGIPLFKDVPILGWLFKSEAKSSRMEEVLIFITPNILKPQMVAGIQDGPGGSGENRRRLRRRPGKW